jgi:2-dehydropantoate 2-reductase
LASTVLLAPGNPFTEAGNRLELDAIGGAVVRAAGRHGIPAPVTSRYADELRGR